MHNFSEHKKAAIEQLIDMNKRATNRPAITPQKSQQPQNSGFFSLTGNPMSISPDTLLIVGLILILAEDCRDKWLFLALIYILL